MLSSTLAVADDRTCTGANGLLQNRLLSVTDAESRVTRYAYDDVGNQVTQTDALNHRTTFWTDVMGRRIARVLPMGQAEQLYYDIAGRMTSKVDFNGRTTTYSYAPMDLHDGEVAIM